MAFTVAPTSGGGPYVLSATFSSPSSIDAIRYKIAVNSSALVGSCPLVGVTTYLSPAQTAILLNTGSFVVGSAVAVGSCRTFTLNILRVSANAVIASSNAYVDNV